LGAHGVIDEPLGQYRAFGWCQHPAHNMTRIYVQDHVQVVIRPVRHEALVVSNGGGRPSLPCRRSGGVEAGGSLIRGSPGRVGAASTKSCRSSTAGWAGRGERDGKEYARNRCLTPLELLPALTRWMWAGSRCVPAYRWLMGGELLVGYWMSGLGGHGECLRRSRDDTAGVEPGS